ncbi:hypothetical protein RHSIM_Rhsim01G0151300 [Rhododendron simsii]|uniref:Uncharacterized protein n=1 Tax=Rhododendron simsii TaxID=118357 RepID=A0A834HGA2_RHOSS|nr:hypothetical protein RHSIM_Rhsim01G0151300 [Rhododendron simsii]
MLRWAVVCQEIRQRKRKMDAGREKERVASGVWDGVEPGSVVAAMGDAVATGGDRRDTEVFGVVAAAMGDTTVVTTGEGEDRVTFNDEEVTEDVTAVTGGAGDEAGVSTGNASGDGNTPPTSIVEELLKAAEDRAVSGGQETTTESEAAIVGRFIVTPVLRTSPVELRSGASGIGASEPVPLVEGDFLERADTLYILGALGVDLSATDVLRGVGSPDARVAATLLGVILSQGGSEGERVPEGESEPEEMVKVWMTAMDEAKAFARESRPPFSPETYAPQLHLFEPVGITSYAPVNADYLGDMLLRDRDRHISSTWTKVKL